MFLQVFIISNIIIILNISPKFNAEHSPLCDSLNDTEIKSSYANETEIKSRRVDVLCDKIRSSRAREIMDNDELSSIPDFDLTQIETDNDANQILKRFRRGRGGGGGRSGGGGRFSSGGSRFSSSFSRSSSSGGSRFFGGSRSSSSSGSSRIFSRSGSSSSSSGSGSRVFSHSSSGSGHRVRAAIRTMFRHSPSSGSGVSSVAGGSKTRFGDKVRAITHGGGSTFGTGGSRLTGGSAFGAGGSSASGGNAWVRAGKKFLPHAARFGKRYYQRRKYNQGLYAGVGAGAGYHAGSHMNRYHHGVYYHSHYPYSYYGYPPVVETPPETVDGKPTTVFYCIQEDLNATLVNETLNAEGFGTCNISGQLITCPVEIECKTSEADNCCEDEQGTPYCCGGPLPEDYASVYGGYEDDAYASAQSINNILSIITTASVLLTTACLTIWHRRGQ